MKTQIAIPNSNGETLHATLEIPANKKVNQYAIFAHCFTCSSQLSIVRNISNELTQYGFGVLRFDFTGLGMSEGDFADTNFTHNLKDLGIVNDYLVDHFQAPTLMIGHSLGGAAVLVAAGELSNIKAVATIGAPADAEHVSHLFGNKENLLAKGEDLISIGGRSFRIKRHFLEDLENHDAKKIIPRLHIPLLILHSPQDTVVGVENAAEIYKLANHPKSFISLDGADHLLTKKVDSVYVARSIATWADRYLNLNEEKKLLKPNNAQVVAHLDLDNNFTTQVSNGRQSIVADEPKTVGGDDLGLAPFELLQAALGTCTNMTLKLYAERKKWDLKEVYTHMSFTRDTVDSQRIETITKKIELVGDLTKFQMQRLIEIAAKCPVNKTLLAGVNIKTVNYERNK
jgi:putative redox protein